MSDHWVMPAYEGTGTESWRMKHDRLDEYVSTLQKLKAELDDENFTIKIGLEVDFFFENMDEIFAYLKKFPLDYLIGSVHYLDCGGQIVSFDKGLPETIDYIRAYFDCDALAFAKKYYETVARLPEKASFDILGHFDLITKNNEAGKFLDVSSKEYLGIGFETIRLPVSLVD